MANGSDSSGGDGSNGRGISGLAGALENRIVLLFTAAALGIGGNLAIVKTQPDSRADPFTGADGKELEQMIHKLQQSQALDDQHRQSAVDGYARIRVLESQAIVNAQGLERARDEIKQIREDVRGIKRSFSRDYLTD